MGRLLLDVQSGRAVPRSDKSSDDYSSLLRIVQWVLGISVRALSQTRPNQSRFSGTSRVNQALGLKHLKTQQSWNMSASSSQSEAVSPTKHQEDSESSCRTLRGKMPRRRRSPVPVEAATEARLASVDSTDGLPEL